MCFESDIICIGGGTRHRRFFMCIYASKMSVRVHLIAVHKFNVFYYM